MAELAKPETSLPPARRSKKLVIIATTLDILPLVLPAPFFGLDRLWIAPMYNANLQACPLRDCPVLKTLHILETLILGPSILVALASILLGVIGLIRIHQRSIAQNQAGTFQLSVVSGVAWVLLMGCIQLILTTLLIYL